MLGQIPAASLRRRGLRSQHQIRLIRLTLDERLTSKTELMDQNLTEGPGQILSLTSWRSLHSPPSEGVDLQTWEAS